MILSCLLDKDCFTMADYIIDMSHFCVMVTCRPVCYAILIYRALYTQMKRVTEALSTSLMSRETIPPESKLDIVTTDSSVSLPLYHH